MSLNYMHQTVTLAIQCCC